MKTIREAIDGMKAAANLAEAERSERAAEIRRRIQAGESTGDAILDFLAWMWPTDYERALPHYRALAERLRGRKGQYVLMIERRDDSGGCMRSLGPPVEETFSLGVLADDKLVLERCGEGFSRGKLAFPTRRHARSDGSLRRAGGLQEGDLRPLFYDTLFFAKTGVPIGLRPQDGGGCFGGSGVGTDFCLGADRDAPFSELEFHVGDEEIDAWCRRGAMHFPKDAPNEARCELIAGLAKLLGASGTRIRAVSASRDTRRTKTLAELDARVAELRTAMDELYGDKEPERPGELVKRIRTTRAEIRRLLDAAEDIGCDAPQVQRLRAAYPRQPAK